MKVTLVKEKKSNQQRKFNDSSALSLEHISEKLKTLKPLTILKNVNIYIISLHSQYQHQNPKKETRNINVLFVMYR